MPLPYLQIFIFVAGLFLLLKGADWITKYAYRLSKMWGISQFEIGLTLVAATTSLPELTVSVLSGLRNVINPASHAIDIAAGTIIGSNIANIALILGFAALLRPIATTQEYMREEYFMTFLTFLFAGLIFAGLNIIGGLILIAAVLFYFGFLIGKRKTSNPLTRIKIFFVKISTRESLSSVVFAFIGGIILILGSMLIIDSVEKISLAFGVSEFVIALILIAVGTSLPELSASTIAAVKGLKGISIGNIIGSNVFNILALGLTSLITTVAINPKIIFNTYLMLIFTLILLIFAKSRLEISKKEGIALLTMYIIFVLLQILII